MYASVLLLQPFPRVVKAARTRHNADQCGLADDYGALEPSISGKIMELHHDKHHATYVNSLNTQMEKMQEAQAKGDVSAQIAIQPLINFHGGTLCQRLTPFEKTGRLGKMQQEC